MRRFMAGLFSDLNEWTGYKTNIHGSIELTQTALTPTLGTHVGTRSFERVAQVAGRKRTRFVQRSHQYARSACASKSWPRVGWRVRSRHRTYRSVARSARRGHSY